MADVAPAAVKPSQYRPDVDGLRAVAVIAVLIYHIDEAMLPGGFRGVDIFFVISGYVVLGSMLNHTKDTACGLLLDFFARRIKRLWPSLIFTVLLASTTLVILLPPGFGQRVQLLTGMLALVGWTNNYFASLHASYFDNAVEALQTNPFMHTWSLGVEEQFYLAFAPLVILLYGGLIVGTMQLRSAAWPSAALSACILLSLATSAWIDYRGDAVLSFYLMPLRGWQLLSGALVQDVERFHARTINRTIKGRAASALLSITLELAAVASIIASFILPAGDSVLPVGLLPVIGTVCFLVVGNLEPVAAYQWQLPASNALLATSLFSYVGKISYPMYLFHWPVLVITRLASGFGWQQILASLSLIALLTFIAYHGLEYLVRQWRASTRRVYAVFLPANGMALFWLWLLWGPTQGHLYVGAKATRTDPSLHGCHGIMEESLLSRDLMRSPANLSAALATFLLPRSSTPTFACSECTLSGGGIATPTANAPPMVVTDADAPPCYLPVAFEDDPDRSLGILAGGIALNPCWFDGVNGRPLTSEAVHECVLRPVTDKPRSVDKPTMFLLGDSHTYLGCLLGLMAAVGDRASITMAGLGSGPPCTVGGLSPLHQSEPCKIFEQTVLETLKGEDGLRAGDTVVYCYRPGFVGPNNVGAPEFDEFAEYLAQTLVPITADASASLLLVGDWGDMAAVGPDCLGSIDAAKSEGCAESFRPLDTRGESAIAALASTNEHVFFFDTHPLMCESGSCSLLIPGTEVMGYLDSGHLSRAGSLYLWPWFDEFLQRSKLLGPSSLQLDHLRVNELDNSIQPIQRPQTNQASNRSSSIVLSSNISSTVMATMANQSSSPDHRSPAQSGLHQTPCRSQRKEPNRVTVLKP